MKKFVLIASARTGSQMLQSYLNYHSRIAVMSELFNPESKVEALKRRTREDPDVDMKLIENRFQDVQEYLDASIWRPSEDIDVAGFRLFYVHGLNEGVREKILKYPDLCLIHLQRRNILRQFVSLTLAKKSKVFLLKRKYPWLHRMKEKVRMLKSQRSFSLDPKEAECFFKHITSLREREEMLCQGLATQTVFYEDLLKDSESVCNELQDFLGVKRERLQTQTLRQINKPLEKLIANYAEVQEYFSDTPWSDFFRDAEGER